MDEEETVKNFLTLSSVIGTEKCVISSLDEEKVRHFMDNKAACEEISQELARESLIGLSYCLPDKVQNSEGVPQSVNDEEKLPVINGDEAEKYRSELISISDSQSPDTATSPVASVTTRVSKNQSLPEKLF